MATFNLLEKLFTIFPKRDMTLFSYIFEHHPDKIDKNSWEKMILLNTENIEEIILLLSKEKFRYFSGIISKNKYLTFSFIEKNLNLGFDWWELSLREDAPLNSPLPFIKKAVCQNPSYFPTKDEEEDEDFPFYEFSYNKNLTKEIVERNPSKNWDWEIVEHRFRNKEEVNWKEIKKNGNDWEKISENLPWKIIKTNLGKYPFVFKNLSRNPTITLKTIKKYKYFPWDLEEFSYNPSVNITQVKANKDFPWNFFNLSLNRGISLLDALENHDLPSGGQNWDWIGLCERRLKK